MNLRLPGRRPSKPSAPPPDFALEAWRDPRKLRELWLAQASDFMEQYMRSSAFLTFLHYGLTVHNARSRWSSRSAPLTRVTARQGDSVR